MPAILPFLQLDTSSLLKKHFALHQIYWIEAEDHLHAQGKQVCALAEKSIRIGWTYADAFKNVRKRLRFKKRDYLFVTKDYPSALEYMQQSWDFAELFDLTRAIISRGEEFLKIPRLGDLCNNLVMLRRGDLSAGRLAVEQRRLAMEQAKSEQQQEAEHWEWTKRPDIQAKLYPHRDPDKERRDVDRLVTERLLGIRHNNHNHHETETTPDPACLI